MNRLVIYIHGKGGNAKEAEHYKPLFPKDDVTGYDYQSQNPWEARVEFSDFYEKAAKGYASVIVVANSIGANFTMAALADKKIEKAFFISPIVDMEKLIQDMMRWTGVTKEELREKGEIPTEYVCEHPVRWKIPTYILYGEKDHMTSEKIITTFAKETGAFLTIMPEGEHWFHTEKQMGFLDKWITDCVRGEK